MNMSPSLAGYATEYNAVNIVIYSYEFLSEQIKPGNFALSQFLIHVNHDSVFSVIYTLLLASIVMVRSLNTSIPTL